MKGTEGVGKDNRRNKGTIDPGAGIYFKPGSQTATNLLISSIY